LQSDKLTVLRTVLGSAKENASAFVQVAVDDPTAGLVCTVFDAANVAAAAVNGDRPVPLMTVSCMRQVLLPALSVGKEAAPGGVLVEVTLDARHVGRVYEEKRSSHARRLQRLGVSSDGGNGAVSERHGKKGKGNASPVVSAR